MFQSVPTAPGELQISEKMANAITGWLLAFYQRPAWLEAGYRVTNAPINVTDYMSTLACNEIAMSAGASARGTWINDQLTRFLLPQLKNAVQLAGAGGRVVVKPYPSGRNIYCEIIPADRIYPTRINGAGVTEAGFFTDFAALRGRKVVRVEAWDLQPDGLYLQNRAYWYNTGDTLGGELALTDVPEWAGLEPEVVIRGVDRPLFGELRMPMANTVDETSKLPVSLYARAVDTMAELDRIYKTYGTYLHKVDSFEFEGLAGMDKMKQLMADLRAGAPTQIAGYRVVRVEDYARSVSTDTATGEETPIDLPKADVLTYHLDCGASVIVRPSGTEPKIKTYYSAKGESHEAAAALQQKLAAAVNAMLGF